MAKVISKLILDHCIDEVEDSKDNKDSLPNPAYLPRDAFKVVMEEALVKETIKPYVGSLSRQEQDDLLRYALDNPQVFLTLASSGLVRKIKTLWEARVKDCHLPIKVERNKKTRRWDTVSLANLTNETNLSPDAFVEGESEHNEREWGVSDLRRFVTDQWLFHAVIFNTRQFLYPGLSDKCPLPFVEISAGAAGSGNFGKVFRVGLRRQHLKLGSSRAEFPYLREVPDSKQLFEVAVKQLQRVNGASDDELEKFFKKEATTLKRMRTLDDPHLIQAIAVYERGSERCIVFPWAPKGNLRELWRRGHTDHKSEETRRWAWEQILGLTRGLAKLHGKVNGDDKVNGENIRHGDLKPENILRFNGSKESKLGPLVIADVGIAKYHAFETEVRKEKNEATTNRTGTQRYTPPEIEVPEEDENGKLRLISRKYDSWSLGCVLLEFITWLRHGRDGLARLDTERLRDAKPKDDRYWEQYGNDDPVLRPAVHQFIRELLKERKLPAALRDLLELVKDELLVPSLKKRKYVADFLKSLEKISQNCSTTPSYLWDDEMEALTEPREPTATVAVIADADVFPISQRYPRTSKLVDKWETVNDSSLSVELLVDFEPRWPQPHQLEECPGRLGGNCKARGALLRLGEIQESLPNFCNPASECDLCNFLRRRLSALNIEPKQPLTFARVGSTIMVYPLDRPIVSLYCDPVSGPSPSSPSFAQSGLPLLPEPGSAEQFGLLKSVMHHCDTHHDCMKPQEDSKLPTEPPTRLIDVGTSGKEPIRLIETDQSEQYRYIALSHCWGQMDDDQRFCTYQNNLEQRMADIPYNQMPSTFRDAVRVTRALGVRYLWIDSLCIIQRNSEDWLKESGRMEDVFNNAHCTIAASSASSSLVGFLGPRQPRDVVRLTTSSGPLYLAEAIDDFATDVDQSVLSSRGWVFQERALSRRTIFFTSTQVYWECGDGVICETLAHLRNPQSHFLGDSNFPHFALQFYKDERTRLLQHFYTTYSALALSRETDRPQAIAGLQRRIARVFKSDVGHGVFWRWPARTLLWCAARPGSLSSIDYDDNSAKPPSWSWMAYSGRIAFLDIDFGGVDWTEYGRGPPDAPYWALELKARELRVEVSVLRNRAVLDVERPEALGDSWRCVVLGKEDVGRDGNEDVHYVLLIRPVTRRSFPLRSDQPEEYYERVGVASLLGTNLGIEEKPVLLV